MMLKTLFKKPVDRPIEGVIKADDDASLKIEIEEYVLTHEVEKRLEEFLDAYNNYNGANGVWVSGFFGSGKSHLLKVLALLLENRKIGDASTLDLFLPKVAENEIFRGDLKRAVAVPSKSILFNIDQKADIISKTQIDALLSVFMKVFDEMCGYYGKQGYIAQFERELDSRGLYEDFKSCFVKVSGGRSWQTGREQALLETLNIEKAYKEVTGSDEASSKGILDKYRNSYRVSIEDFADRVNTYLNQKSPDFRLNFFVDEVGQYIAENVKLMTNLQTIAETLATKCRGRAWVIVTAQEDMEVVVGAMGRRQNNDFSKIQDRFKCRLKLTSADVEDVIQKRLLEKKEEAVIRLTEIYHAQSNNFKTLFNFFDGSQTYQNFQDRDHFIRSYPFIPYQFALFQSAIQSLSVHNAFEGKHSSVGERSMIGVFQEVAKGIGNSEIGSLATFDRMFEGIRSSLKSNIQSSILQAEKHLGDPYAVRLLKTLFLVKYVKGFKPTVRNLCVLMYERFDEDLPILRKAVEEALGRLERETYVQRNGEFFEYLTDEEKDIEQEIRNTEVDTDDLLDEMEKIIFDGIIKDKKIRFPDQHNQSYSFMRKLDDHISGQTHELALHVITPLNENVENELILKSQNMGRDELLVVMPSDARFVQDLLLYKRSEKYIRQNHAGSQKESVKAILNIRAEQNEERRSVVEKRIRGLLGEAAFFISGQKKDIKGEDPQTRIRTAFANLVDRTYPNRKMLGNVVYTENDLPKYLPPNRGGLSLEEVVPLSEAEQEILTQIRMNNQGGVKTSVQGLVDRFEKKPYGWYMAAVLCILAGLHGRNKIEVRSDGNILEGDELERSLRNAQLRGKLILYQEVEYSASQIRILKDFFEEFFSKRSTFSDAKILAREIQEELNKTSREMNSLFSQSNRYPFLKSLEPVQKMISTLIGKPPNTFLALLEEHRESLLTLKKSVIDPISVFMNGQQKTIYDHAKDFLNDQKSNLAELDEDEFTQDFHKIQEALSNPECFRGDRMQQVKSHLTSLEVKISSIRSKEVESVRRKVDALKSRLLSMPEVLNLSPETQSQMADPFDNLLRAVESEPLIPVIRDSLRQFEEKKYVELLSTTTSPTLKISETIPKVEGDKISGKMPNNKRAGGEPCIAYVRKDSLRVPFDKPWLADESDVELYLNLLRDALLKEIQDGKRIQV